MTAALKWLGERLLSLLAWMGRYIDKGGDTLAVQFEGFFIIGAMIGIFLMMAGGKRLGTKISSISILSYLLLKVLF